MKKTLLIITALMLVVGCGSSEKEPVDETILINKEGVMYLPDSDTPYTGEVFTNYDTGEKEYQGTYENGLLVSYSYLHKDGRVKDPVNGETLIDRSGLLYEVNGQKPYTGDVFELYDDGGRKHSGSLKGGKKDKLWTEWSDNGKKQRELTYKDGEEIGSTRWEYYSNGQKATERTFKDGKLEGRAAWWYKNGQKWYERTYKDGELNGEYSEWYANGQKEAEGTLKDGKLIEETNWDEDGNVTGHGKR